MPEETINISLTDMPGVPGWQEVRITSPALTREIYFPIQKKKGMKAVELICNDIEQAFANEGPSK